MVLHRLEVDVGRAGDEGAHDDLRAELDDRGVLFAGGGGAELVLEAERLLVLRAAALGLLLLVAVDLVQEAGHHVDVLVGIEHPERGGDLLERGDRALDVLAEDGAERVERLEVHRVGHRDREDAVLLVERDDAELLGELARQERADGVVHLQAGDVEELHPELLGQGAEDVVLLDLVGPDQGVDDRGAGLGGVGRDGVDQGLGDHLVLEEDL